jgi:hypothetical protein
MQLIWKAATTSRPLVASGAGCSGADANCCCRQLLEAASLCVPACPTCPCAFYVSVFLPTCLSCCPADEQDNCPTVLQAGKTAVVNDLFPSFIAEDKDWGTTGPKEVSHL